MKKLLLMVIIFTTTTFANNIFLVKHDYNKTLTKAKKLNKPIFLMYSTTTCPECNYMKQVVFTQKRVKTFLKQNFVTAMLDIKRDKLPKELKYIGIPTFFIISKDGRELGKLIGGMSADKFLNAFKKDK